MSEPVRMSAEDREKLQAIVAEKGGPGAASRSLEIDESTLARALAGFGVRRATITHLRVKIGDSRPLV